MARFIRSLSFSLFLAATSPFAPQLAAAEPPTKPAVPINVLLLGDRAGHHRPEAFDKVIAPALEPMGIHIAFTQDIHDLNAEKLSHYDCLAIYGDSGDLPPAEERALLEYVEGGHGLVAIHCASNIFRNSQRYTALIGGRFQKHETGVFRARIIDAQHPAMRGVLEYVDLHSMISLADFCFLEDTPVPLSPPPWTGKVDGVVMEAGYDPRMVAWVKSGGVPAVNAGSDLMDTPIVSTFADPESLARTAVEHLHGIGYRHFLYVGIPRSDGSRRRRKALAEQLKQRGCKLRALDIAWKRLAVKRTDRPLADLLIRLDKPLAIVALNDTFAAPISSLAQRLGFRIPDEVGILGVGDTPVARISSPPISTIRIAEERIGHEAVRLVHRMIDGQRLASKNLSVPGEELIVRASTVPKRRASGSDIQQVLELIRRKACEGIKVSEVAAQMRMSVRMLELEFAAEVGHSVGDELRQARLQRAKELLLRADLSITRVANLIGYADSAYFTRFFRQHTGQTPSERGTTKIIV